MKQKVASAQNAENSGAVNTHTCGRHTCHVTSTTSRRRHAVHSALVLVAVAEVFSELRLRVQVRAACKSGASGVPPARGWAR